MAPPAWGLRGEKEGEEEEEEEEEAFQLLLMLHRGPLRLQAVLYLAVLFGVMVLPEVYSFGSTVDTVRTSVCAVSEWLSLVVPLVHVRSYVNVCYFGDKPRCSASWPVWTRRTALQQWFVHGWYCWFRAVLPFVVHRLKMFGILVGMDQKDILQRHSGRAFRRLRQCMCKAGIAGFF